MTAASVTRSARGSFGGCASGPDGAGPARVLWSRAGWVMERLPWPAYLGLGAEGVAGRAETALRLLGPDRCTVCPRLCKVDRLGGQHGLCAIGRQAVVASHFPHFGEEDCLRGRNGSGPGFFSRLHLPGRVCPHFDISSPGAREP